MPNNDLISRKYVIKELLKECERFPPMVEERYGFGVKVPSQFHQAMRGGIRKGLRIVETAPAVDAEPVRHGEWEIINRNEARCSECKMIRNIGNQTGWNFCPNCGAKMEKEE